MAWTITTIQRPDNHTCLLLILLSLVVISSYMVHTSHHLTPPPLHAHDHDHVHSLEDTHQHAAKQIHHEKQHIHPELMHHSQHTHAHARTAFKTGMVHHHTRIALCFSGSLRTFATTVHSYKMKLIRPLLAISGVEIHIFAHVWKDMEPVREGAVDPPTQPASMSALLHSIFAAHDMLNYVRVITSNSYDEVVKLPEYQQLYQLTQGKSLDKEKTDPTRLLFQHFSIREANRLKHDWELTKGWNFTWVYRCRYDMLIRKALPPFWLPTTLNSSPPDLTGGSQLPHSSPFSTLAMEPEHMAFGSSQVMAQQLKIITNIMHIPDTINMWHQHWVRGQHAWMLNPNIMYVPSCEWWGGIGDGFALSSSHLMDIYSERLNEKAIRTYLDTFSSTWHPEMYLMWYVSVYHNITILPYPICFSILRQADDAFYKDRPAGICAYGNEQYKGRGCCRLHCRQGDPHCFPNDWEPSGNANTIANPLIASLAPTTYNVTDVNLVLQECNTIHANHTQECEIEHVKDLVERNIHIRRVTAARCPPLPLPPHQNGEEPE